MKTQILNKPHTTVQVLGAAPQITDFARGSTIARRYTVIQALGKGAGGCVYLCRDKGDGDNLKALKVLTSIGDDIGSFERFYREAKATQSVLSPYVVQSYDVVADDGVFAYTMEYVPGKTLYALMEESAGCALPLPLALNALAEIAEGLVAIHKAGIVHRDLKPTNVLVTENLQFKIADFGVAYLSGDFVVGPDQRAMSGSLRDLFGLEEKEEANKRVSGRLTSKGSLIGTVDYMSPESLVKGTVNEKSDLYSLGTLAFELLAGKLPFPTGSRWERLRTHVEKDPPELSYIRAEVPDALNDLIMSCLSRNPEYRPDDARSFLHAIREIRRDYANRPTTSKQRNHDGRAGDLRSTGVRWQLSR